MEPRNKSVLLISNQYPNKEGIGNPIISRILKSTQKDNRISRVEFCPFTNSFSDLKKIRRISKSFDVVHIHFGGLYVLVILLYLFGIKSKKIITFHGTDIHAKTISSAKSLKSKLKIKINQIASFISIPLFSQVGFVSKEMEEYVPNYLKKRYGQKFFEQRLGVDYEVFKPLTQKEAKNVLGLKDGNYVLFSTISNSSIKRQDIAEEILNYLEGYQLLIMSNVKPEKVPYYIGACDFLLLTSDQEGSPNIVRECMAMNRPVFSVDVGDVKRQISDLSSSCIIPRNPQEASALIRKHLLIESDDSRAKKKELIDIDLNTQKVIDRYFVD